jgi:hypothetical protein
MRTWKSCRIGECSLEPSSLATSCVCQGFQSNSIYVVGQLELSYQKTCYSWSQELVKCVNLERKKESITNKQSEN